MTTHRLDIDSIDETTATDTPGRHCMTPEKMLALFERQYLAGKASAEVEYTCAGFAAWLAQSWERLGEDERAVLTGVGATLWREGYERSNSNRGATKDLW
jgi:hypothetical protein